jgi:hypothetical protein
MSLPAQVRRAVDEALALDPPDGEAAVGIVDQFYLYQLAQARTAVTDAMTLLEGLNGPVADAVILLGQALGHMNGEP